MLKYVLFDFDGTLVDSRDAFINAFNHLADRYNFRKIEAANMSALKDLSMIERFRYLNIPIIRIPFLTKEFLTLYNSNLESVSLIPGITQLLKQTKELPVLTGIVSTNSAETIQRFMSKNGIRDIDNIYCSSRLFGKDRIFRKFLKTKKLQGEEVVYVCDELRDITACRKVDIRPIWVSWGFENREALKEQTPFDAADSPEELFTVIQNLHRCKGSG